MCGVWVGRLPGSGMACQRLIVLTGPPPIVLLHFLLSPLGVGLTLGCVPPRHGLLLARIGNCGQHQHQHRPSNQDHVLRLIDEYCPGRESFSPRYKAE